MRAYYASKISPNISQTPKEGFLICKNVPIARTGFQEYYGYELSPDYDSETAYKVYRTDEEVFSPKAMASFEGKPVTDDHPNEDVTSENSTLYLKGVATNIRRGAGDDDDKLLADLIIYDKQLAEEIDSGKREISCGYDCITEEVDGKLYQKDIRGNHVAVVDAGRAGSDVRIKDQQPEKKKTISIRRNNAMSAKKKLSLADKIASLLGMTKDADPQEAAELIVELAENELKADEETTPQDNEGANTDNESTEQKDEGSDDLGAVLAAVQALTDNVQKLSDELAEMKSGAATDNDPLAALEQEIAQELSDDESGEEEHAVDPDLIDEEPTSDENSTNDEGETEDEEPTADEEQGASTADKERVLAEIRRMKPIIAGIKDKKAKKTMADSLTRMARTSLGTKGTRKNGYKAMNDARANALKKRATHSQMQDTQAIEAQSQAAYDKLNPHLAQNKKGV